MNKYNASASELFDAAEYFYKMAVRFEDRYWNHGNNQSDMSAMHMYKLKAAEAESYAELLIQEGLSNTLGFGPEWIKKNFVALNPANIKSEVSKAKEAGKSEIPNAEIVNDEAEFISKKVGMKLREEEAAVLSKKRQIRESEPPFVTSLRSEIIELLEKGLRGELVTLLTKFHFRDVEYPAERAYRFINLVKEQFNILEPSSSLKEAKTARRVAELKTQLLNKKRREFRKKYTKKHGKLPKPELLNAIQLSDQEIAPLVEKANKWGTEKIPVNTYVYARYTVHNCNGVDVEEGYAKRHKNKPNELWHSNRFVCFLSDVEKWRPIYDIIHNKEREMKWYFNNNPVSGKYQRNKV